MHISTALTANTLYANNDAFSKIYLFIQMLKGEKEFIEWLGFIYLIYI